MIRNSGPCPRNRYVSMLPPYLGVRWSSSGTALTQHARRKATPTSTRKHSGLQSCVPCRLIILTGRIRDHAGLTGSRNLRLGARSMTDNPLEGEGHLLENSVRLEDFRCTGNVFPGSYPVGIRERSEHPTGRAGPHISGD